MTELACSMLLAHTDKAYRFEVECDTEHYGRQTALIWVPKSCARWDERTKKGSVFTSWLERLEEKISTEHPDWGCVGIRVVEA